MIQVNGSTALYGIIGNPVAHSFSPAMQTAALQAVGINAVYLPFLAQPGRLQPLLTAFLEIGLQGFNVTVPFKEEILPLLDEISPMARRLGSVNTVVRENNRWVGHSTDGAGFVTSLEATGFACKNKRVCLLGAGGSAKALAWALAERGIYSLTIINRTPKKSMELGQELRKAGLGIQLGFNGYRLDEEFDLLINSTSLGMKGGCPAEDDLIRRSHQVVDIIYNPAETELLQKARAMGKPASNGLGMLLYQGVQAFEIWTKQAAPVTLMHRILETSLQTP